MAIIQNTGESKTLSKTMTEKFNSSNDFQNFLKKKLDEEHYALSLSDLSPAELFLLIKNGLDKPDLLVEYTNKITGLKKRKNEKIDAYRKEINQWAFSTLEDYDRYTSKFMS